MNRLALIATLALISTGAWALTLAEIESECELMKGNEFAIKKFSDSNTGQRLEFIATLVAVNALEDGTASIELKTQQSLPLYSSTSSAVAADLRVGVDYWIIATLDSVIPTFVPDAKKCLSLRTTGIEFQKVK
jgi:hypothetical protein